MPSKLTPEVHEKVVRLVRAGNFRETACAAAGITSRTMRHWMALGADGHEPYAEFAAAVDQAEAEAEARDVARVVKAGDDDWRALAWRLERKSNERWARRDRPELTVQHENPATLSDAELDARIAEFARERGWLPGPALALPSGVESERAAVSHDAETGDGR